MADTYVVKKGDTLSEIAQRFGTTTANLAKINDIYNPNFIVVGQIINLKATFKPSVTVLATKSAVIKQFGLQSNTDRTVYAFWDWHSHSKTEKYSVEWDYDTGDGWFEGTHGDVGTSRQSTYNAPANAKRVRFRVKPISKKYKKNKKETTHFNASWTGWQYYSFANNPPVKPGTPSVTIEGTTLTVKVAADNLNADEIQFRIYKSDNKVFNTVTAKIVLGYASYSLPINLGESYKADCRSKKGSEYSGWSAVSDPPVGTRPSNVARFTACRANSKNSIYVEWTVVSNADSYTLEWTTDPKYFDSSGGQVQSKTDIKTTNHEIFFDEGTGAEYFFRVKAVNDKGDSGWAYAPNSAIIGTSPAAPTTWSSTTKAKTSEPVTLYWVHNSKDGSKQTAAQLEITVNGVVQPIIQLPNILADEERNSYILDTSSYSDGTTILWSIRTSGITKEYGDWSAQKTIEIFAPATLQLKVANQNEVPIDTIRSYPINVIAIPGPETQKAIGCNISIISNDVYTTIDAVGNEKTVNEGEEVYSKYFDSVITCYKVTHLSGSPEGIIYELTDEIVDIGNKELTESGINEYTTTGKKVYSVNLGNGDFVSVCPIDKLVLPLTPGDVDLENGMSYKVIGSVVMNTGLSAESTYEFTVDWEEKAYIPNAEIIVDTDKLTTSIRPYCEHTPVIYYQVDKVGSMYIGTPKEIKDPKAKEATWDENTYTVDGDEVYSYVDDSGNTVYFYVWTAEAPMLVEGVKLAVYRREYDGRFVKIEDNIDNTANTFVPDPHPALDYARYRIVATTESTGAVGYNDLPGEPIGEHAVIIQWAEQWTSFDATDEDSSNYSSWNGTMLKLPYNIDVSDKNDPDVSLVKYIGRQHSVSYYGTQLGISSTWNVEIDKEDKETLYALRKLQIWMGDVYVREPSGSGYWANIKVSFSQKHCELTIPVTLDITRVEGGI